MSTNTVGPRRHLWVALAGIACALAGCQRDEAAIPAAGTAGVTPAPAPAAEEPVVNVYNWSDYVAEDTIAAFEQKSGIKVVYDVYDNNELLEAKLMAGSSGYDLVFPSARPFGERHVKAGLYRALDKAALKGGYDNLDPAIVTGLADVDPDNAHLVPYLWGSTGIGYNVAKVRERLGADTPLDSWSLLFDPATTAKLADCGIAILDDEQEAFGAALLYAGRSPNEPRPDDIDVVSATYAKIRPHVRYFGSSQYIDDLANGEICIAMGYSGDVLQARDRAREAANDVDVAYVIPKEGALRWIDTAAVPVDAPHPRNAHALLAYLLEPDVIAKVTDHVAYANANTRATPLVEETIRTDPGIYPTPEVIQRLVDPRSVPDDVQRARVRAFTSIKTGA